MTTTTPEPTADDPLRSQIADEIHAWARQTPVMTGEGLGELAGRLIACTEPYTLADHETAELVPAEGAVFDAEGALLQRSPDGLGWFQPGHRQALDVEAITLPAVVVHPWGWRP